MNKSSEIPKIENDSVEKEQENKNNNEISDKEEEKQIKELSEEKTISSDEKNISTEKMKLEEKNVENNVKEKKEEIKEDAEEVKNEEKELTVSIKNNKKMIYIFIVVFLILIVISVFSTIFALKNRNNSNIIKGIKIKNIDVSNMLPEDANNKLKEALNLELMQKITVKYKDFEQELDMTQYEFTYNIDEAVKHAYKIGRTGNILEDNNDILSSVLFGKNIDVSYTLNEENLDKYIEGIQTKLPGVVIQPSYYIEDTTLNIEKGTDGIVIDKDKFKKLIFENIKKRDAKELVKNSENQVIEIPVVSKKADSINMDKIYEEIHTEPKDAYYELDPLTIYPEVNGVDLEIGLEEAKKQIESEDKNEYQFTLKITPPEKTVKSFGKEAFPYLASSFSTRYNAGDVNRTNNLAIAAGKINGYVLMPGEVFSFNKIVGKRTVEEGYRDAKIYADGGVVDGLAGGICQISSTLYNAVLLANLEIVERRNHSFTTSYLPAGRDATVVYGKIDFQFKNSRSYPIKIEAGVSGGVAVFSIYAVSSEENEYEIKILPSITQSIPYTTQYVPDATLLPGQQVVSQAGHAGYKVTTYKETRQNGNVISRELLSNDTYTPMRAIVRVGQ